MTVFFVIAFLAAVLHVVLEVFADTIGTAIVYAIAGLLCGLVLRTRLAGVRRTLVVWLFAIGFVAGGVWSMKQMIAQAEMIQLVALHGLPWGLIGLGASIPYLGPRWRLALPLFAAACFGAAGGLSIFLIYEGFGGFLVTLLSVNPVLVCLAAGVFDQICASVGLESPEEEFERLRIRFEFRLR
jgi:hypothetical protein